MINIHKHDTRQRGLAAWLAGSRADRVYPEDTDPAIGPRQSRRFLRAAARPDFRRRSERSRVAALAVPAGLLLGASLVLGTPRALASEESVDAMTQSALALDANPRRGALQFHQYCEGCHGRTAHGNAAKLIPSLAGQRFAYLVRQLANLSGDQRDSPTMHGVLMNPELRQPQTWVDVAAYLNAAPLPGRARTGDGTRLELGAGIFREQCASCHRDDASGDDDGFVPSLRNQHYSYLVGQIDALARSRRHNVDERLVQFLRSLDADEAQAVADYLSRLRGPGKERARMRDNGVVVD